MNQPKWNQDASVADIGTALQVFWRKIKPRALLIVLMAFAMALLGWVGGSLFASKKHKAEYIIAAEEQGASGWESLLAQFGLDVGSSNPGGIFEGESLVRLFRVRTLIERALMQPSGDNKECIADALFRDLPESQEPEFKGLRFLDSMAENATRDTALYLLSQYVNKEVLTVNRPDKKQSFITVACVHSNPDVAMKLSASMIETVTDFYIETLTKKARNNLNVLRLESDSVQRMLNTNLMRTASQADFNINPLMQTARVSYNRAMVDLQISISLYEELTKNLKLAEIGLRKETPLIQIIESPHYPLDKVGLEAWQWAMYAGIIGLGLGLIWALSRMNKEQE